MPMINLNNNNDWIIQTAIKSDVIIPLHPVLTLNNTIPYRWLQWHVFTSITQLQRQGATTWSRSNIIIWASSQEIWGVLIDYLQRVKTLLLLSITIYSANWGLCLPAFRPYLQDSAAWILAFYPSPHAMLCGCQGSGFCIDSLHDLCLIKGYYVYIVLS